MNFFRWTTFDVTRLLPPDWQAQIMQVVEEEVVELTLVSSHSTSREATTSEQIPCGIVEGVTLRNRLPWLADLYDGLFLEMAQSISAEKVSSMSDPRFGMVLNVQRDTERYECHVDSNPIAALLYCTSHPIGAGGELAVSNRGDVRSVAEIDADCSIVEPRAGHLVLFDARRHSHYVRRLTTDGAKRVVVAMNYYTTSSPELEVRPPDLNRHLIGVD
ncbi:2OG-Fe(II) oxygenase [Nocardia sp. alder85J]|uniref:2OG-Fe(II) oxygenase n=1 Tax=Nocardia sp. alder85J TaxID=2862949 RepID=UPI001CD1F574|nr:2OG-Fe(II) oxygenase [Nocardia sp. alder85J]MCX4093380.1 2OG-Fe(II) oxygenase [Nocardia sp. alder85J]